MSGDRWAWALAAACCWAGVAHGGDGLEAVARSFAEPPASARPWVYWMWIDGNVTKEGITADLEGMARVGIGGALIADVSQSMPGGEAHFFDARWQALFKHAVGEAKRLGLEINMNNGAGYYGSGGTWVPPERAMQTVVSSETVVEAGKRWSGELPRPVKNGEYRDLAVVAVPGKGKGRYKIRDFEMKSLTWKGWVAYRGTQSAALEAAAPAEAIVPMEGVVELTEQMGEDGKLTWEAPAGAPGEAWTILRMGHCWNGSKVGPSRPGEAGPETDKLEKGATKLHFDAFVRRLNELVGPEGKGSLVGTHIDSWEGGGQNWTRAMREEFTQRRGYDPVRYLPILTGRVLGDLQRTERFLFDLRLTVSELMMENYTEEFQRLAHEAGLRFTFESYTTIGNDLDNAMYVDEPMAEFWTPNGQGLDFQPTVKAMASAAHLGGRSVVGAEAFTSGAREKFKWHPGMIKAIGDKAMCGGVNRFVFHRYAMQPFGPGVAPGMQMGPWGLHYERTNTWWEFSKPWHTYVARCQEVLRQGEFVGDVLKVESEEPLKRFKEMGVEGYDYDACGPGTLKRAKVVAGRVVFAGGAGYRLVVLPETRTMTVGMLERVREMVQEGAVVLGEPPERTPGLTDYPRADETLRKVAEELWGTKGEKERRVGKGRVLRGMSVEEAMGVLGVLPDFGSDGELRYIHRRVGEGEVYFVSSQRGKPVRAQCVFRVAGKRPELWDAESGREVALREYEVGGDGRTRVTLPLEAAGSAFVVFRGAGAEGQGESPIARVLREGKAVPGEVFDVVKGEVREAGTYDVVRADGGVTQVTVPALGGAEVVKGPWKVAFEAGRGAPGEVTMETLAPWNEREEEGLKYFSGVGTYRTTMKLGEVREGERVYLDLGEVEVAARVRVNGKEVGTLWKPPYRVEVTGAVKAGENALEVEVVNVWVNRLIGDEQLPEDSERNKDGTVKAWPRWLEEGKGSPTGRVTFSSWRLWKKGDALVRSGLMGPVRVERAWVLQGRW